MDIAGVRVGGRCPVRIMGVLNASPESFYRGSVRTGARGIAGAARRMEDDGADFVDVGGMSTAPYLRTRVPERTEAARVAAAVRAVAGATNLPISVDTYRAGPARAALDEGASIINDVTGLQGDPRMPDLVAERRPAVVLCAHRPGGTGGAGVAGPLSRSVRIARRCGASGILLDPAIGFFRRSGSGPVTRIRGGWAGRDARAIREISRIRGYPVLVSVSRKSFIGEVVGRGPEGRLAGSLAAEAAAVIYGADVIRTHDVAESRDAAGVARLLRPGKGL
ncbi:Dihydropteroate synthase [Nitrosopumilaceae archaeon]|nr:dihydropteroate synthase [Nitrosopumilus sp.]MDA7944944.1 dihydropteroate synthase [Nitrosopumilus sp.]MDA7973644.1 dihydropteroate synthase [Nitrosopumilus sp.]CAI9832630.1 Dihydropteroate synthase [Nitrosopumilaceae archaeon]